MRFSVSSAVALAGLLVSLPAVRCAPARALERHALHDVSNWAIMDSRDTINPSGEDDAAAKPDDDQNKEEASSPADVTISLAARAQGKANDAAPAPASAPASSAPCPAPATPAAPPQPTRTAKVLERCGNSTFVNRTSKASPLVADCRKVMENIAMDGEWTVWPIQPQRRLVDHGTCALGVKDHRTVLELGQGSIGNGDIIAWINGSINRFGDADGRVGAMGNVYCGRARGDTGKDLIDWGLYHR